jgi:hypothetical protein
MDEGLCPNSPILNNDLTRVIPDKTLLGKVDDIFGERG